MINFLQILIFINICSADNWNSLSGLDYIPTSNDSKIVKERIIERAKTSKQVIKYYGKNITVDEYINLLK